MKKTFLIVSVILFILQPAIIRSEMPPDDIMKRDQDAEVIVMGEVYDKGGALLVKGPSEKPGRPPLTRFILMKVVHVIKGDGKIKPNSLIHILCEDDHEKNHEPNICHPQGIIPFRVERGNVVIVYADKVPHYPGFYSYKTILPFFGPIFFAGPF